MPSELVPPAPQPPSPEPEPRTIPERPAKIVCQMCECTLVAMTGDVLKMSDLAKQYRDQGDEIDDLKAELDRSQKDLADALRERDEARAAIPEKRKGIFS